MSTLVNELPIYGEKGVKKSQNLVYVGCEYDAFFNSSLNRIGIPILYQNSLLSEWNYLSNIRIVLYVSIKSVNEIKSLLNYIFTLRVC